MNAKSAKFDFSKADTELNEADIDDDAKPKAPSHEDNADPITDPRDVSNKPGRIKTKGSFIIHTQLAHRLFYGRKKANHSFDKEGNKINKKIMPIIGVTRYVSNINALYDLAEMNDPYADAKLIEIEDELSSVKELLINNIEALQQLLGDIADMEIQASFSIKPITLPLEFSTPFFGFEASRIVKYYDRLVLLALTTRQTGDLLESDWNRIVNKTATKIRSVFYKTSEYKFAGASRDDMAANNKVARAAIEKYGELPQDILEGRKRAKHAPKIRTAR